MDKNRVNQMIISYYNKQAIVIAKSSVEAYKRCEPEIELYDEDFYYSHLNSTFNKFHREDLIDLITENKLVLDNIMLDAYRNV